MTRFFIFLIACIFASAAGAAIVYVDADAPGCVHNGASWETAFTTIGDALNSVQSGADIWVKAGTYPERITLKNYVNLYGGFMGYETSVTQRLPGAFPSIIDACRKGRAVDIPKNAYIILDGFVVRRGSAAVGGGIRCDLNSNVKIRNCRIENCTATQSGGGVYFGKYSHGELTDSVITCCSAPNGGGGVIEYHSYPDWRRSVIVRNHASANGGGIYCPFHSGAYLENCTLAFNTAGSTGGAVYADYGGPVTLNYCIISDNSAPLGGGIYGDGTSSQVSVSHTDFYNNSVGNWSGSILGFPTYSGNVFTEPMFIKPASEEYHLAAGSQCGGMGAFPLDPVCRISRIGVAKTLADGTAVQFAGKVVSCVDGYFTYIQEPDRASTIVVRGLSGYQPGDVLAWVTGTLAANGRILTGAAASLHVRGAFNLKPVGVPVARLQSAPGLFACTWGRVESITNGIIILRDGNSTIHVRNAGSDAGVGDFISVTGVYTIYGDFAAVGGKSIYNGR